MRHSGRLTMAIIGLIALIAFPVHSSLGRQLQDRQDAHESHEAHLRPRPIRNLNSGFLPTVPAELSSWQSRAKTLRQQLRLALGLIPPPPRAPLEPVIHGKILLEGYSVEKVYFESAFGFLVTGNLYRPLASTTDPKGLYPGVLCPHGHHANGRFLTSSDADVRSQIEKGAESFEPNAKSILQARCANLAKMGCVVFHYDMIGYADSGQISYRTAHGFRKLKQPPTADKWPFYSPRAESLQQNIMGLQTWNSIRALDFLCELPDVDANRIGVTGASGGGTQTFILCALDDRPKVAFPAVMVSTGMQGGCTCENCAYLRVEAGNVDFAALFAPKPMGLTAANDWTREMKTKGFPELRKIYSLFGDRFPQDNLQLTSRLEFGHNYNQVGRQAMYSLFAREFGLDESYRETATTFVDPSKLTVYDAEHVRPEGGPEFEHKLLRRWEEHLQAEMAIKWIGPEALHQLKTQLQPFHSFLIRQLRRLEESPETQTLENGTIQVRYQHRLVHRRPSQAGIRGNGTPQVLMLTSPATTAAWSKQFRSVVVVEQQDSDGHGKVSSIPFANGREAVGYTLGYNLPPVLTHLHWLRSFLELEQAPVVVCGLGEQGIPLAVQTPYLADCKNVRGYIIDSQGFRFRDTPRISDSRLLPAAARYHDLEGLLSSVAPKPLLLFGETVDSASQLVNVYRLLNAEERLVLHPGKPTRELIESFLSEQFRRTERPSRDPISNESND